MIPLPAYEPVLYLAFDPVYILPLPEGHRFPMMIYEMIPEQLIHEGLISSSNLFSPGKISEDIIVQTHCPTYWEHLRDLRLSPAEIRRSGFPLSARLVEREIRIAQGNGTAEIFSKDPRVFTFSIHAEKNFPFRKEHSDLDIGLDDGTGDQEYLSLLSMNLTELITQHRPDFVFYLAGVDVLASDKLGKLDLSLDACTERDAFVLGLCKKMSIPVQISMGGGYSAKLSDIVEAHCNTYRTAYDLYF